MLPVPRLGQRPPCTAGCHPLSTQAGEASRPGWAHPMQDAEGRLHFVRRPEEGLGCPTPSVPLDRPLLGPKPEQEEGTVTLHFPQIDPRFLLQKKTKHLPLLRCQDPVVSQSFRDPKRAPGLTSLFSAPCAGCKCRTPDTELGRSLSRPPVGVHELGPCTQVSCFPLHILSSPQAK